MSTAKKPTILDSLAASVKKISTNISTALDPHKPILRTYVEEAKGILNRAQQQAIDLLREGRRIFNEAKPGDEKNVLSELKKAQAGSLEAMNGVIEEGAGAYRKALTALHDIKGSHPNIAKAVKKLTSMHVGSFDVPVMTVFGQDKFLGMPMDAQTRSTVLASYKKTASEVVTHIEGLESTASGALKAQYGKMREIYGGFIERADKALSEIPSFTEVVEEGKKVAKKVGKEVTTVLEDTGLKERSIWGKIAKNVGDHKLKYAAGVAAATVAAVVLGGGKHAEEAMDRSEDRSAGRAA